MNETEVRVGQVYENRWGDRFRIEGFSKLEDGWIKVREVGGDRARWSLPPEALREGRSTLVSDPASGRRLREGAA